MAGSQWVFAVSVPRPRHSWLLRVVACMMVLISSVGDHDYATLMRRGRRSRRPVDSEAGLGGRTTHVTGKVKIAIDDQTRMV
jgi:hypothetical protein